MIAGYGRVSFPVPIGAVLGGYAARVETAHGTLDELEVSCITMHAGGRRLALVVADLVCANVDLTSVVRKAVMAAAATTGRTVDEVWLCATHTHAGPDVGSSPAGGQTPSDWQAVISSAAAVAVSKALSTEKSCSVDHVGGHLANVGAVRGIDTGGAEVPVDVLTFESGSARGALVVVPVHPTVLSAGNAEVSADLPGAIRSSLRSSGFFQEGWVIVATGAAGDISTRRTRRAQTPAELQRLGNVAAHQILNLLVTAPKSRQGAVQSEVVCATKQVDVPSRHDDLRQLSQLRHELLVRLEQARSLGDDVALRVAETSIQGLQMAAGRATTVETASGNRALAISAANLGGVVLLGVGGEPFVSLHSRLKARLGRRFLLFGYTNGYAGYLPDRAAFDTEGYETLASPFRSDISEIAATALANLYDDITTKG